MLFIDEIHRLQPAIEEVLYPAMEDFQLDLIIGEGPAARSVRIDLAPFTLVGATTRAGLLATPLRDRFGIPLRLVLYTPEELRRIVARGAEKLGFGLTDEGATEIARRSRGTPRIAGRLLRRVRDFAAVARHDPVDRAIADAALTRLEVDHARPRRHGPPLPAPHRRAPPRRPVGVETLAAALAEARDTLEDVIEPYLIQEGLILRTSRGRMLGEPGWRHLGLVPPRTAAATRPAERGGVSVHTASPSASITKTPTPAASSITPAIWPSPSAPAPRRCATAGRHMTNLQPSTG